MGLKLFISCDEATTICTKNQYKEASFLEKVKLNIHLLNCKICGLYSKQNTKLTDMCNTHLKKPDCEQKMGDADKEALKLKLKEFGK